jgi:hypothetical protein
MSFWGLSRRICVVESIEYMRFLHFVQNEISGVLTIATRFPAGEGKNEGYFNWHPHLNPSRGEEAESQYNVNW